MSLQAVRMNKESLSEPDITNYWQYYGLSCDPFAVELHDDFYFSIPRWEEYLDLLQFLCHYNNVLLAVTGNNCSGKTTLLKQFHKQVNDSMRVCELKANSAFTSADLVQVLSEHFNLTSNADDTIEEQLEELTASIQESSKICLLLIDDAHLLSSQVLRHLLYIVRQQSETQMKLHFVLFGEPHLQSNLARICQADGDGEELIHNLNIGFLSLDETEKYLDYRLTKAGFEEMPLVQTVINRIYKLSGGAPGRINRIARRTLLNDLIKRAPEEKESFLRKNQAKLMGGTFIIAILAVLTATVNPANLISSLQLVRKQTPQPVASNVQPRVNEGIAHAAIIPQVNSAQAVLPAPAAAINTPEVQKVAPQTAELTKDVVILTTTAPAPVAAPTPAMLQDTRMLQATLAAASAQPSANPTVPARPETAGVTSSSANAKPADLAPAQAQSLSMEAALLAVPANQFGLQLSGLSKESAVKQFIANNHFAGKAHYYRTRLNGKDWFVIIYGQFKSPAEAKAAINQLPEAVQALKPWVRSYASVHAAIKGTH